MIRAVLWDFGGVLTSSPFEAFARFERERGYPAGFIRSLNATNPDTNAWARFERGQIGAAEFDRLFAAEASAAGHALRGLEVLPLIAGDLRPEMVEALRRCKKQFKTACLTNNFQNASPGASADPGQRRMDGLLDLFDFVLESSRVGVRKPDPRFYRHALDALGVSAEECVFLDDLGVNLKPARALGMRTIKVVSADQALSELEAVLEIPLRD
jgi:putative hydrolase of the HAD superfamily